jgi:hypothetical protein
LSFQVDFLFKPDYIHLNFFFLFCLLYDDVAAVICLVHHFSPFEALHYFILPLVERHEEHMHVLEASSLLVELGLEDTIVHHVDASHGTIHQNRRLIARVVPVVTDQRLLAGTQHRLVHDGIDVVCQVAAHTTVLFECVSLINGGCLTGGGSVANTRQDVLR